MIKGIIMINQKMAHFGGRIPSVICIPKATLGIPSIEMIIYGRMIILNKKPACRDFGIRVSFFVNIL